MTLKQLAVAAIFGLWLGSPQIAYAESHKLSVDDIAHVHGIAFDPTDSTSIYLATHYGVFRVAADGSAAQVSENSDDYMGFSLSVEAPATMLASGHPAQGGNLGVIKSEDGGANWRQVSLGQDGPVDFHAMTISRADPSVIYGLYGGIQVSLDGGRSWRSTGAAPARTVDLTASPTEARTLYAATMSGTMTSRDSGASWETMPGTSGMPVSMIEAGSEGRLYAFEVGTGFVTRAEDAAVWTPLANSFGEAVMLHLAIDPVDAKHIVAVMQDSALLVTRDGGQSWAPF